MGLIKYKTNLTSLKFGKDRPGGGSSNQPFITKDVSSKRTNTGFISKVLDTTITKASRSADDVSRISQFIKTPEGVIFSANQNLLSKNQVDFRAGSEGYGNIKYAINGGLYNPINTITQVGKVAYGGHQPKQSEFTGGNSDTMFGGIINNIISSGLNFLGIEENISAPSYLNYYKYEPGKDKSRLKYLHSTKGYEYSSPKYLETQTTVNTFKKPVDEITGLYKDNEKINDFSNRYYIPFNSLLNKTTGLLSSTSKTILKSQQEGTYNDTIYEYAGGPGNYKNWGSTTKIRFAKEFQRSSEKDRDEQIFINQNQKIKERSNGNYLPLNILSTLKLGENTLKYNTVSEKTNGINVSEAKYNPINPDETGNENPIKTNEGKVSYFYPKITDFRDKNNPWGGTVEADMTDNRIRMKDPTYRRQELTKIGDDKKKLYDFTRTSYIVDEINASGILDEKDNNTDDLIKFRIGLIDRITGETKWVRFRAFIDSFSDNYNAQWNDHKFMGRGEKFYKYDGFDRSIDLSFTVASLSRPELIPMYKKLNWVASLMAPDYGSNGYMSGNIITLTIGGYLYEVKGILQGMNIAPHEESPWEIGLGYNGSHQITSSDLGGRWDSWDHSVKELPHVIKVTGFKFTPIHDFTPKLQKPEFYETGSVRFISLANGEGNNFTNYKSKTSFDL